MNTNESKINGQLIQINDITSDSGGMIRNLVLNQPDSLNALSLALVTELKSALENIAEDKNIRCLVLSANGRAFCVGADLKERAGMSKKQVTEFLGVMNQTFNILASQDIPTIAALPGFTLGGGLEMALCCDFRLAPDDFDHPSCIGLPETALGIIPGAGGTQRLSRTIGLARAREMILGAKKIARAEALEMGMLTSLHPAKDLAAASLNLAKSLIQNAPIALAAAKKALDLGYNMELDKALELEQACYNITLETEDRIEALAAFREKRKPAFKGK